MEASSAIAVQIAQSRSDFALSSIKQNADAEKNVANMLQSAASSVPNSPIRGLNVNIKA